MKLKTAILSNFRAYSSEIRIPIDDFTVFVGKNDAGKSTILEALEIFFNSEIVKMQFDDSSKGTGSTIVRIGCVFSELPEEIVLDTEAKTSLAEEYLLNTDGDLEISKLWDCSKSRIDSQVFLKTVRPSVAPFDGLIRQTNAALKKLIEDNGLREKCSLADNPSMRRALYASADDLQPCEAEIRIDDAKAIWEQLRKYLPEYGLFQADRPCKVDDSEIQDPMKLAVKEAIREIHEELDRVEEHVRQRTEEIAKATVEKLKETHPDLAADLVPTFKEPTWNTVFKIDLEDEAGIPINKRGSGVRRLILLSFFRARAERARRLRAADAEQLPNLILGIEEPEAAQHPESQRVILESFLELTEAGDQVLITTHEPALAGLAPAESLRLVTQTPRSSPTTVEWESDEILQLVADSLGVLPHPLPTAVDKLALAVVVEGQNDVDALLSIASVLSAAGLVKFCGVEGCPQVFWVLGGGDQLQHWVNRKHVDKLGLRQVHIYDSDRRSSGGPAKTATVKRAGEVNARSDCVAFVTERRCMDNYLDPAVVRRAALGVSFTVPADTRFVDMGGEVRSQVSEPHRRGQVSFPIPLDKSGNPLAYRPKVWISQFFLSSMTKDELIAQGEYVDASGQTQNEILSWFAEIDSKLNLARCAACSLRTTEPRP